MSARFPRRSDGLTERQFEVLTAVCELGDYQAGAEMLGISQQTVKHHLSAIRSTLGMPSIATACLWLGRRQGERRDARLNPAMRWWEV